ncbi:hypothetical protein NOJ05_19660 [Neorhizobium galegae]|uniref:hypothetical protein n=1 Tax=Neorhizobium galegae TaxID=399 RepID=UPI0021053E24|nr:hypothetical protein [Neorhizobium galegae]MCQ1779429.1 hypothetical protein [Neorhizobium galegae]MCQ1795589.1 hypothetical protein [Neorhizobium galegae]
MDDRRQVIEQVRGLITKNVPISTDPIPDIVIARAKAACSLDEVDDNIQAYRDFCARYEATKSPKQKIVMKQILNWIVAGEATDFRYGLGEMLDDALKQERKAQKDLYPDDLYRVVGDPVGWALRWDSINIRPSTPSNRRPGEAAGYHRYRRRYSDWSANEIAGAYIEIGKHTLYLRQAVDGVLKGLEDRYNIDFKKLEKEYQRKLRRAKSRG